MLAKFSTFVWIFSSWRAVQDFSTFVAFLQYKNFTDEIHFYRRFSGGSLVKIYFKKFFTIKGQIMSECIYEITDFPKYHRKNLIDFCPGRFYRLCRYMWFVLIILKATLLRRGHITPNLNTFQGKNLSDVFGDILK